MNRSLSQKPAAQLSLEAIVEQHRKDADALIEAANAKATAADRIEAEMARVLSEPPPTSRLVEAFSGMNTVPPPHHATPPPPFSVSTKMSAEKEVVYAALAIVRSWQRRHKKKYNTQETVLMKAIEGLTWEK